MAATQKLPLPFATQLKYDAMVEKGTDVDGSSSNKYWMFFIPCLEEKVSYVYFLKHVESTSVQHQYPSS